MAERPERSSPQEDTSSSTKDDVNLIKTSKSPQENYVDEQLLQDIVEVECHPDCPVCLQPSSYPVKLPCGHIFCFLCIKGVALRSRKCAICRQPIAADVLEKPTLVKVPVKPEFSLEPRVQNETETYVWYYEGRNGWWRYDDKTSKDVEAAFKNGKRSCTLLIAGFLYLIDFENMFQMRRNEPGRRRRIKRDKRDVDSKGVAGIRLASKSTSNEQNTSNHNLERNDNETNSEALENQNSETNLPDNNSDEKSSNSDIQGGATNTSGDKESGSTNSDVDSVTTNIEAVSIK